MRKVILESPYAGEVELHLDYARYCLKDSLMRGEAPIASHLLHTQVLNDEIEEERNLGINAGHQWLEVCEAVVVYTDLGISKGMRQAIEKAKTLKLKVDYRKII